MRHFAIKFIGRLALLAAIISFSSCNRKFPSAQETGSEILALTGSATRVVWVQDFGDGRNMTEDSRFRLMGFDTSDSRGERQILPEVGRYNRPLITPAGNRVVYSDLLLNKVFVTTWDGSSVRELAGGFALDVWMDPSDGKEWVYVKTQGVNTGYPAQGRGIVRRHQIDDPAVSELIWDLTPIDSDFQLSGDGTHAAGLFPWPEGGIAELPNRSWKKYGTGCYTCLSPDNTYRLWIFDGAHRNVELFEPDGSRRTVNIASAPGIGKYRVYYPRWSNHPRYMTMAGPFKPAYATIPERIIAKARRLLGNKDAQAPLRESPRTDAEIYIGRFDNSYTKIGDWVQVTHNTRSDKLPDVWIRSGQDQNLLRAKTAGEGTPRVQHSTLAAPSPPPMVDWPGNARDTIFLWEDRSKSNQIVDETGRPIKACRAEPRGLARFGRHFQMDLTGGAFVAQDVENDLLVACRKSNQLSVEALITTDNVEQPRLARIITFSSSESARNFTMGQDRDKLVINLNTTGHGDSGSDSPIVLCSLAAGKPHHVIVSYSPGRLVCYLNGDLVFQTNQVKGNFDNWISHHLVFGDEWTGGADWSGTLEGITLSSRFIESSEARQRSDLYLSRLKARKPVERLSVQARLTEPTAVPNPSSIAPYRRALVVCVYEIEKVLSGKYDHKKLLVAHWGIMDGKVLTGQLRGKGGSYTLVLERFEDHPELEGERQIMDSDLLDLPLFYDISR